MRIQVIAGAAVAVALLGLGSVFAAVAGPLAPPPAPEAENAIDPDAPGKMELFPKEFQFGRVWEGTPVEQEFTVKNVGKGELKVKVKTSCGCTPVTTPDPTLAPGESTTFKVTYDTRRRGAVKKHVRVMTNDPDQKQFDIPVEGLVKPIYARRPVGQVLFNMIEINEEATERMSLENEYTQPVKLKLQEGQDFGPFKVDLKTIEEGQKYELEVTTVPPLQLGSNRASVVIETDLESYPKFAVGVFGNAQPRVLVTPPVIAVHDLVKEPMEHLVRVQYRKHTPLKIREVLTSIPSVTYEILPEKEAPSATPFGFMELRVKVPGHDDIPLEGGKLVIVTDDKEYERLEVPIMQREAFQKYRQQNMLIPGERGRGRTHKGAEKQESAGDDDAG